VSQANIVRVANRRIWNFVRRDANKNLLPATGSYSTPFRGGLFGETASDAVAEQLSHRRVDVLWLGTNPCVSRSLEHIIHPPRGRGDFPTFENQMKSGLFGSWLWDRHGNRSADWNPIERPAGNWHVYRDMLSKIARLERVAMSNFLPWGSKNANTMVETLCGAHRPLLERMFEFADELNIEIVQALAPKLLVVPFSLGRNRRFDAVRPIGLTLARAIESREHLVALPHGAFIFYTGYCRRGRLTVRTVFLRHPSSLRLGGDDKRRVVTGIVRVLETC
jgi:hypothetical protein